MYKCKRFINSNVIGYIFLTITRINTYKHGCWTRSTCWTSADGSAASARNFLEATPVYSSSLARFAASHSASADISGGVRIDDRFTCPWAQLSEDVPLKNALDVSSLYQTVSRCVVDMASSCISCAVHAVQREKLLSTSICHRCVYDSCQLSLDFRVFSLTMSTAGWKTTFAGFSADLLTVFCCMIWHWGQIVVTVTASILLHFMAKVMVTWKTARFVNSECFCVPYEWVNTDPHLHSSVIDWSRLDLVPKHPEVSRQHCVVSSDNTLKMCLDDSLYVHLLSASAKGHVVRPYQRVIPWYFSKGHGRCRWCDQN